MTFPRLNFRELGDNSVPNIKAGDLRVAINIASHPVFERDRNNVDLRADIAVNSINAILGTTIAITGIDKKAYNVKIPAYASHGQVIRLNKKGMPMMNRTNIYGDLYIIVNLETPQNLSQEQISLLKQVRNSK